jgi:hypothetical protein
VKHLEVLKANINRRCRPSLETLSSLESFHTFRGVICCSYRRGLIQTYMSYFGKLHLSQVQATHCAHMRQVEQAPSVLIIFISDGLNSRTPSNSQLHSAIVVLDTLRHQMTLVSVITGNMRSAAYHGRNQRPKGSADYECWQRVK